MKENTNSLELQSSGAVRFRELVGWWSEHLGRHHIPLREQTNDINDFLAPDAVHHDLIRDIVRKVYCANHCGHLDANVSLENTFMGLGRAREALLGSSLADVDQINLLDSIGWHTRQYFGLNPNLESTDTLKQDTVDPDLPTVPSWGTR